MRFEEPTRVKELLRPLGRKMGMDDGAAARRVWGAWVEIVGPDVAMHAEPTSLRAGVLRVRTESTTWATEIGYLGPEIARRANEVVGNGAIKEVKVWTSPAPIAPRSQPRSAGETTQTNARPRVTDDPATALKRAWEAWSRRRSKGPR